jgi:glycosyltransferase involved in cell wall biosynthesis
VPKNVAKVPGRVCTASRLSWEKGHQYLLRAWPGVKKAVPDANLVIVGEGVERGNIEALIKELNIGESVTMVGLKPHPDTLVEMTKANVFICPSLAEGLGTVFIESQACGTPPVGTKVGGVPDVIQNEVNGILIDPKSAEQCEAAMIKLLTDKEFAQQMIANGIESSKKYDWSLILDQIDGIYHEILK